MASGVVLVNGLPGSGKTTLAVALAAALGVQCLSKDAVKEAIAAILEDPSMVGPLGSVAMDTVWALAAVIPATVVIESWWFRPRDLLLAEAGLGVVSAPSAVEIWCDVPADLARTRYETRNRPLFYDDVRHLADDWPVWASQAQPLALTPVLRVDTSRTVDHVELARTVRTYLAGHRTGEPVRARVTRSTGMLAP
jgi:predicted kinase